MIVRQLHGQNMDKSFKHKLIEKKNLNKIYFNIIDFYI